MSDNVARMPRKLYKYKGFGVNTLRMLGEGEIYFSLPAHFNDPFDCSPTVYIDVELKELELLWQCLQMKVTTRKQVTMRLKHHRNTTAKLASYDDGGIGTWTYSNYLVDDIDEYIKGHFAGRGVLSLATRWDNPLMWSHYADEHRGLCIEFDTGGHHCERLEPVAYTSTRYLCVSDLCAWHLNQSRDAEEKIGRQFFFAKSPRWRYEQEWRAISSRPGVGDAPFRITAVHLGLRCDRSITTAVVKMLADERNRISFYGMWSKGNGFELGRYRLAVDEILATGVRSSIEFGGGKLKGR